MTALLIASKPPVWHWNSTNNALGVPAPSQPTRLEDNNLGTTGQKNEVLLFIEVKWANRECYTSSCNRWLWILNVAEREKDEQWHWTGLEIEDPIVCPTNYQLQCCQSLFRTRQPHQDIVTSEVHQCPICHRPFRCSWFPVVSFMAIIGCFTIFVENQGLTNFNLQKSCHLLNVIIVFTTSSNFSSLTPPQIQLNFYTHPNPF